MTYQPPKVVPLTAYRWPRGPRRAPSRRQRAPTDPYGTLHRKIRAALMAALAASGGWPCPICGLPMTAAMRLHLHHSNPEAKLMGHPGDQLAHAKCNIREGARLGQAVASGKRSIPGAKAIRQSRVW